MRWIHRWPVNSPAQRANNAENVSISWRHHVDIRGFNITRIIIHNLYFTCEKIKQTVFKRVGRWSAVFVTEGFAFPQRCHKHMIFRACVEKKRVIVGTDKLLYPEEEERNYSCVLWTPLFSPGVGVTKAPFANFSVTGNFDLAKV